MQIVATANPSLRDCAQIRALLDRARIGWSPDPDFTVLIQSDDDEPLATGSRRDNVLKCIAVAPEAQGEGFAATVVTELAKNAVASGHSHLFIFTTPKSAKTFTQLGFHTIAETEDAALLENRRNGIQDFVAALKRPQPAPAGIISAVVANCNPFTNGHRHLVETAAKNSAIVHLFIVSADKSRFSAADRMAMVRAGTKDLPNVILHPTGDYLISPATFPTYFIKDTARAEDINCALDLAVFAERFAQPLGITRRYVGTEPADEVTRAYNRQMHLVLPKYGIEVTEIPRLETNGAPVSAGRLRALLDKGPTAGGLAEIARIAPRTTVEFLRAMQ